MSTFVTASATAWAQIVVVNMCRSHALARCECDVPPMLRADVQSFALWCAFPCWELSGWCRVTSDSTDDTLLLFSVDNTQVLHSTDDTLLLFSVENTSIEHCSAASCSRAEYCVTDKSGQEGVGGVISNIHFNQMATKPNQTHGQMAADHVKASLPTLLSTCQAWTCDMLGKLWFPIIAQMLMTWPLL